ncbi:DUF6950 family protein [Variovorax sp. PAMC26660]|uniref:DUF6950 family protein n=1 Tax=Variovorax sp. PAMC26660 TaxID=2762322 RepID=UPI00164E8ADF|nr:hypothetical protein [Variovorax sp. PAMC26660]QNK70251.1 hypothetical protein H7F35_11470 [Variovorax sp. PAMC26660]
MNIDLDTFIDARRHTGFAYFEHDCATIAADWVRERRGTDPLEPLRAQGGALAPKRLLTALRHVRAAGGFEAIATALLGQSLPGRLAQRGDVVLARSGGRIGRVSGYSFGVCTGSNIVAPGKDRLQFLPLTTGVAAWRV